MKNRRWSLRKKTVWNPRGLLAWLLMVVIIVIGWGDVHAQSRCPLRFAAWMTQEDLKYYKHALGESFTADGKVLLLPAENTLLVFYGMEQEPLVHLSAFHQGTEHILWWEDSNFNEFDTMLVPSPQLALGQLDAHAGEDILACYSVDCGTPGIGSKQCWDRSLVLVLNGQTTITPTIPLSGVNRHLAGTSEGGP